MSIIYLCFIQFLKNVFSINYTNFRLLFNLFPNIIVVHSNYESNYFFNLIFRLFLTSMWKYTQYLLSWYCILQSYRTHLCVLIFFFSKFLIIFYTQDHITWKLLLSPFFGFLKIYLYYLWVFTHIYVRAPCVWLVSLRDWKMHQMPSNWSYKWMWATMRAWALGMEPHSSTRAVGQHYLVSPFIWC